MTSIKSKIVVITLALLFALGVVVIATAVAAFYRDKELTIAGNNASVTAFEGQVNRDIAELEKNALDLALMGEIYYKQDRPLAVGEFFTSHILKNYPNSMGNGIYFLPYKINPEREISCIHAVWENDGTVGMLPSCVNSTFDYFKQDWYTKLKGDFERGSRVSWSRPYLSTQLGILMTTVGARIDGPDGLIGMATIDWELDTILKTIFKMKPTPHSFVLFADRINDYILATTEPNQDNNAIMGKSLSDVAWYSPKLKEGVVFEYKGVKYIPYIKQLNNGFFLIVNVPVIELFQNAVYHLFVLLSVLLISMFLIVGFLYLVMKHNINQPIATLTEIAQSISQGDLDRTIQLDKPSELAQLASAFNKMKTDIKTHLTELAQISIEKEKMASELSIAQTIQASALPQDFPKNKYYELSASMTPAREVGGDFYDFFPIDENRLAFVMADVCGKGITAALYMMSAKTAIKNMLQAGYPLEEAINKANKSLCDNHALGMFVTAFIGILDIRTGQVDYINAGHCPPLLKNSKGYAYLKVMTNMVLGGKSDFCYKAEQIVLKKNNRLFLYTDGVTEAQTKEHKMFGEQRLLDVLNEQNPPLFETLPYVHQRIQDFVAGAAPSDDITMLILELKSRVI